MTCLACGVSTTGIFSRIPHYVTWAEFEAARAQHYPFDFAAWQVSHAAWMQQQGGSQ